ncbi:NRDE-2, necessary for RNA interference-domain-containing protein [Sporodiniella umbellata]|nr:NRDE-2, necessary for RNA interference-domain-containing protein [Sporodiniella umbellata]
MESQRNHPQFASAPQLKQTKPPQFSSAPDFSSRKQRKEYRSRSRSPKKEARSSRKRSRSRDMPRSRRREDYRDTHRSDRDSDRRSKKGSRHRRRSPSPEPIHSGELKTGFTFIIDKRGDPDLVIYSTTHTYASPQFRRSGNGRVIGFKSNERIGMHEGKTELIDLSGKRVRYTDASHTWQAMDTNLKRLRIKPREGQEDPFTLSTSFVQLETAPTRKTKSDHESLLSLGVDYRSLEGNRERVRESEEESEEEEGESYNESIRRQTIEFNQKLDKAPHDVALWLAFIDFQEKSVEGLDGSKTGGAQTSMNEVKLSIFDKALSHNPEDERLILAYLACGAKRWDTLTLLKEWDQQLKRCPDSIQLWSEYINTRQTNFASFSFSECCRVFEDALGLLQKQMGKESLRESIECLCVYVVLRACLMMQEAGYHERALAVFQAVVEYTLFAPPHLTHKTQAFMDFWDQEVPRLGEPGAQGWAHFYQHRTEQDFQPGPAEENPEIESVRDWLRHERALDSQKRVPLRMAQVEEDQVEEDPYRITLFDDVSPYLINLKTPAAHQTLIYSLLVFLGLPYTPPGVGTNTHVFTDTFTHNHLPMQRFWPPPPPPPCLVWYVSQVPMEPEVVQVNKDPFFIPPSYPVGLPELFAQPHHWFSPTHHQPIHQHSIVQHVFQHLLIHVPSVHLQLCYLSFLSNQDYKLARKVAKQLLKEDRDNLILWNAYAQMEKSHSNLDAARKVYLTALAMCRADTPMASWMYLMFAKLEMEAGRPAEALKILVSMSSETAYNENASMPTALNTLKAREHFSQQTLQKSVLSFSENEQQEAVGIVTCSALFEYLSSGLEDACHVFERTMDYIKERQAERGYVAEMVMTEHISLLYQHTQRISLEAGYKPRMMRSVAEEAIGLFPNNTLFIAFYSWNEAKAKVFNRVQIMFNQALNKNANVVLWLSAIYHESHRGQPYSVDLIRNFFERAIQDANTKSSILIWKTYIEFEVMQNNKDQAKALFYRSLRDCPWSKELYLLGLEHFEKTMDEKELNELASLMIEKEIRLRTSLTDWI